MIALTPGSRRSFAELLDLSKAIAAHGYRVLLHDRRNCGASDVAFDGSASEHEVWADDLYELGQQLDALPMYVGGSSAGARLAILFALRHPTACAVCCCGVSPVARMRSTVSPRTTTASSSRSHAPAA